MYNSDNFKLLIIYGLKKLCKFLFNQSWKFQKADD